MMSSNSSSSPASALPYNRHLKLDSTPITKNGSHLTLRTVTQQLKETYVPWVSHKPTTIPTSYSFSAPPNPSRTSSIFLSPRPNFQHLNPVVWPFSTPKYRPRFRLRNHPDREPSTPNESLQLEPPLSTTTIRHFRKLHTQPPPQHLTLLMEVISLFTPKTNGDKCYCSLKNHTS